MSESGYKIRDQNAIHFITFAVIQWIDVFSRSVYKDIVVESLKYCQQNKGLKIHAWVIMSNHIHLICSTEEPFKLSDVLRDFKKHTSKQIIKSIENNTKESRGDTEISWNLDSKISFSKINKFASINNWILVDSLVSKKEINKLNQSENYTFENFTYNVLPKINTDDKVYFFKTSWLLIKLGNSQETFVNGFVILNQKSNKLKVFHFWGE